jgi:threonine synthase
MALEDQKRLGLCGLYLELSSAAALSGLRRLVSKGDIAAHATVVLVGTSNGLSEPRTYSEPIAAMPGTP